MSLESLVKTGDVERTSTILEEVVEVNVVVDVAVIVDIALIVAFDGRGSNESQVQSGCAEAANSAVSSTVDGFSVDDAFGDWNATSMPEVGGREGGGGARRRRSERKTLGGRNIDSH